MQIFDPSIQMAEKLLDLGNDAEFFGKRGENKNQFSQPLPAPENGRSEGRVDLFGGAKTHTFGEIRSPLSEMALIYPRRH